MMPYELYNGSIGVRVSYLLSDEDKKVPESICAITYSAYNRRCCRQKDLRLKEGRGPGNEALLSWEALPDSYKSQLIAKFGDPQTAANPLEKYFKIDGSAKKFYDEYQFEDGTFLRPDQISKYTTNASVLGALEQLKHARETSRKMRGGSSRNVWPSLISDLSLFNDYLKQNHGTKHSLPTSDKLKKKLKDYQKLGYASLIDGRNKNQNKQVVTPLMLSLWKDIYAGQKGQKPNHYEVYGIYQSFLTGQADIINNNTGELYDRHDPEFRQVSDKTIYNYQTAWESRSATHAKRSGDRQEFMGLYKPFHKLKQPEFAGSILSIDDRQPPFKWASGGGNRMWFYMAQDLGSEAITCWVYGDTKEGIITDFYKQLVRNYAEWNIPLPFQLECESSLNSSFKETFLQPGSMFQAVRIEANNARGKRIERTFRDLRYNFEKEEEAWVPRPHARSESNKTGADTQKYITKEEIIAIELRVIYRWNNSLHSNQELHPGMTRWQVFLKKQHPELPATNWAGILPFLGEKQESSMKAGRITLQSKHRMVGFNGKVATGESLINIMRQIEGQKVLVRYMKDGKGEVLKALVYNDRDQLVCELLGDFEYQKAVLEQTPEDLKKREIISAYSNTVEAYIRKNARAIESVTVIKKAPALPEGEVFTIPGLDLYEPCETEADALPAYEEVEPSRKISTNTYSRF